jgi:MoaA/NifB/PqqE/SkfB family radical SAM enzyme
MKTLTVEITDICPLICQHCSTYGAWDREDISIPIEKFIQILEGSPHYKRVRLSGGEPFMHPEIITFAREAKLRERRVEILTCGVYRKGNDYQPIPEKIIQECRGLVDNIKFSLHGSKKTHEKVVGIPEIFQYLDGTIDRTIAAGLSFSFGLVPLKTNKRDLEGAIEYASRKAGEQNYCVPELYLLRYVKQGGRQYDIPNITERLALTPEENQQIIEQGRQLGQRYGIPVVPTCSMLEINCIAGKGKKVITVYGDTCDCSALKWNPEKTNKGKVACKERH